MQGGLVTSGPTRAGCVASGRQHDLLCTFLFPQDKLKLPVASGHWERRLPVPGKGGGACGVGGAEGGGAMRGRAGVAISRLSGPALGFPVFGVCVSFPSAQLREFCRVHAFMAVVLGPCHSYPLPQVHGNHMGIPSRPGQSSGPAQLPSFAQGTHPCGPGPPTHCQGPSPGGGPLPAGQSRLVASC